MAVLIPCAGRSSRYPGMRPKFLLTLPDGKAMFEAAAKEHVKSDVLHFAFLQEHVEEYDLQNVMKSSKCIVFVMRFFCVQN